MNWASHWEHVVKTRQTERMAVGKTSELCIVRRQSAGGSFGGRERCGRVAPRRIDRARMCIRCSPEDPRHAVPRQRVKEGKEIDHEDRNVSTAILRHMLGCKRM